MAEGILNPIPQLEADFDFDVYTKQEVDALLDEKADKSDTYTKTETDALLDDKADADAVYTKTETDTLLSAKADKSTTLAGYGITDAYTKTETDNLLNGKSDADDVYTKSEIDTKIPSSVGSATKPIYVNGGILTECTHELNKTVPANAVFTDTTYTAGNGLNLSGTSFSAKAGTNVTVDGNGINVNGNGVVASADSGLISGGTAYTELRPTLDGTWVKNAQTTATNLQKLEGGIEYLYGLLSHQYDQLKKYINGNYYDYDTDTDSKYVKTVPNGAMPYASLDSIGGRTLVWNQLFEPGFYPLSESTTKDGVTFTITNGLITTSGVATADGWLQVGIFYQNDNSAVGDKLLFAMTPSGTADTFYVNVAKPYWTIVYDNLLFTKTANTPAQAIRFYYKSGTDMNGKQFAFMGPNLTKMYGAGNEPTTVAEFQQRFPASYYPYNAGTLLSAGVTEVVSKKADTTEIATYSIPASIQALEGYGWSAGTVFNYIDYERKVFVKNVGAVDLGTLTWTQTTMGGNTVYVTSNVTDIKPVDVNTVAFNGISPLYKTVSRATLNSTATEKLIAVNTVGQIIACPIDAYADATAFKTAMDGVMLYYELATPVETDISAYLTDDNLINVESGGTLTFPNSNGTDYQIPVPSSETFMVDLQSALGE